MFLHVYRCIAISAEYDSSGYIHNEEYIERNGKLTRSLRGVLLQGRTVCLGDAISLLYCVDFVGLDILIINGYGISNKTGAVLGGHAWNKVKIDGIWYYCDVTWDRKSLRNGDLPKNCLRCGKDFDRTHRSIDASNKHDCPINYDTNEMQKKLKVIECNNLDASLFNATANIRIGKEGLKKCVYTIYNANSKMAISGEGNSGRDGNEK